MKTSMTHETYQSWNAEKTHLSSTTKIPHVFFFQLKICGILLICITFSFFKLYFWATFSQILFSCNFFDIALLHLQPMCHDYSYSFNCETIENNQPADRHIGGPANFPVSHNLWAHIWQFNFFSSFSFICKKFPIFVGFISFEIIRVLFLFFFHANVLKMSHIVCVYCVCICIMNV